MGDNSKPDTESLKAEGLESIQPIINEIANDPIMDPLILGLLIASIFISAVVCLYSKTLNRRPIVWFMLSFGSSLLTFLVPIGPMICFAILVYK